jgi:hypothetical protein
MTNHSNQAQAQRRIAAAQAARVPVDSQGRPTGPPTAYTYDDERGLLVDAAPSDGSPPNEAA